MRTRTPPLSPKLTDNITVHIVLNDFGEKLGRAFLETDEAEADVLASKFHRKVDCVCQISKPPAQIVSFASHGLGPYEGHGTGKDDAKRKGAEDAGVPRTSQATKDKNGGPHPLRGRVRCSQNKITFAPKARSRGCECPLLGVKPTSRGPVAMSVLTKSG